MPIRFRCAYCNQLMGIATRKAGAVVRCPKCAGEIIVPTPDGSPPPAAEFIDQPSPGNPFAFEDGTSNPEVSLVQTPVPPSSATIHGSPVPTQTAPALPASAPAGRGLFMPLGMLFTTFLIVVLLVILAFVMGLIVGREWAPAPRATSWRLVGFFMFL